MTRAFRPPNSYQALHRQLGPGAPVSGGIRFKCADEQGAVLVLKRGAHREELHKGSTISRYIARNHAKWHQFAVDVVQLEIKDEEIIFVRGSLKTAEWAVAAATSGAREGELLFGGEFGPSMQASFSVGMTKQVSMSVEGRSGPPSLSKDPAASDPPPFDQSVFLLYYKSKNRRFFGPKVIRGAADPGSSPDHSPEHPSTSARRSLPSPTESDDGSVEIESVPNEQKVRSLSRLSTSCTELTSYG